MTNGFKELRNNANKLLCIANDDTGEVKTEGPHKSKYSFIIPVGISFSIERDGIISTVTRTPSTFIVADRKAA